MSRDVGELADAVLHEGYLLYPYQPASLKNLHRYPFGTLYPEAFCRAHDAGDTWVARLECVVVGDASAQLTVQTRFLQLEPAGAVVRSVVAPQRALAELAAAGGSLPFEVGPLRGALSVRVVSAGDDRWKLCVELQNTAGLDAPEQRSRDDALASALCSAHLLVQSETAELVSSIDPPSELRELVEGCRSSGLWPVLVGEPGTRRALLAAPIILYDYPELAPESPGDFFDATEIDELLTLRVLTLTDEEKRAISEGDPRARELLERTEALGLARLGQLHGRLRAGSTLTPGARVRLHPKGRADIFDLALDGKAATVRTVERDLEGRVHIAVTVDEDPGQDLEAYGHRFFFRPEEVEIL